MVIRARDPDPLRRSGGADDLPDLPVGLKRAISADLSLSKYRRVRDHCFRNGLTLADFLRQAIDDKLSADAASIV